MTPRPLAAGELLQLTDPKGRKHLITLVAGKDFHTHRGFISHDEIIGGPEGRVLMSSGGTAYLVLRPLLSDYALSMPRGAAVVYPKDAAQIIAMADIFPGAHVLEAGAGSGALSCSLLRAVGAEGRLTSFERREDFAQIASSNVARFFGQLPPQWTLRVGDVSAYAGIADVDRIVLDMLAPWELIELAGSALIAGGVLCCYVATTTQLSRVVETLREHSGFTEPQPWETMVRGWHVDGLAVRPDHRMVGHTGFLVTSRRLAPGVTAPPRRRRPAKGAQLGTSSGDAPSQPINE